MEQMEDMKTKQTPTKDVLPHEAFVSLALY